MIFRSIKGTGRTRSRKVIVLGWRCDDIILIMVI